jgi:hypothetical protein
MESILTAIKFVALQGPHLMILVLLGLAAIEGVYRLMRGAAH